ncbi:type-2Aa cytolytic delta-endotoxin [Streptomyces sp. NRRL S-337]|uniref:type-2Aa cytolytic delta-endotoxin n=1 Tax=Streptomyces sp. NRRL S-337 TaxID=1463900 RepID=UPI0004C96E01|nr:type-2Aa cytolytic delta-endotoxin [Streptomyces sp. NRRL S-337]
MADQPTAEKTTFRTVFEVGPDALAQTQRIADTFQRALAGRPAEGHDFGAISRAAGALPDCATVKIIPGWGLQETAPIGVMVLSLRETVRQALGQSFANPAFWEKAEAALADAFVGGEVADGAGYSRNLLFALQDEETEGFVHAVAFCADVTLTLDAAQARPLTLDDIARFTIRLNALGVRQALQPLG